MTLLSLLLWTASRSPNNSATQVFYQVMPPCTETYTYITGDTHSTSVKTDVSNGLRTMAVVLFWLKLHTEEEKRMGQRRLLHCLFSRGVWSHSYRISMWTPEMHVNTSCKRMWKNTSQCQFNDRRHFNATYKVGLRLYKKRSMNRSPSDLPNRCSKKSLAGPPRQWLPWILPYPSTSFYTSLRQTTPPNLRRK